MEETENTVKLLPVYYPIDVKYFSSQYGSEKGSSYIAKGLIGRPKIYPNYGDFTEAFVLRTYGKWWKNVPSAAPRLGIHCYPPGYCTQDFVEVIYGDPVVLSSVHIYETYNPGCVVRIFACDSRHVPRPGEPPPWALVWQRPGPSKELHVASKFCPNNLRPPPFPTCRLRIEFNSDLVDYYTEIDSVGLQGSPYNNYSPNSQMRDLSLYSIGPSGDQNESDEARISRISRYLLQVNLHEDLHESSAGRFGCCPNEVLLRILQYLDLRSLTTLSGCSKFFRRFCSDPVFYTSVTLKPFCLRVSDLTLMSLQSRASRLTELDLSWCGSDGAVTSSVFIRFITDVGHQLRVLRLANCQFLDDACIKEISNWCQQLVELDLSSSNGQKITQIGFTSLTRLNFLERLSLYRCNVDIHAIVSITRVNPNLQHLCLGSCSQLQQCDLLAGTLAECCPNLVSVDFWRCSSLSPAGLTALADGCQFLEELDLGWCSNLDAGTGCFKHLVSRCQGLKKLFLTANRTVTDPDLEAIARNCPSLIQLDILGTREVSVNGVLLVLKSCPKLEMFDVSFCNGIKMNSVKSWRDSFPHCSIQMSFQSTLESDTQA